MVQRQRYPGTVEEIAKRIQDRSTMEEIHDNMLDSEFKTAVIATSVARHLCEHIETLSIGAQTRILDTHDYLQIMVPLIDEPPWTRRRRVSKKKEDIVWEKLFDNHEWRKVPHNELLQITKCEAQCWIAVFHLTCSNICRQRYALNVYRKENLLRLRKFLNEVMVEQLPILTDVMRYMDELALMNVPETCTGQGSALLIQQVDKLREDILRNYDWQDVAETQFRSVFSKTTDAEDEDIRLLATLYDDEYFGSSLDSDPVEKNVVPLPITMISLSTDSTKDAFLLTPFDDGEIIQTDRGDVRRIKLKIHSTFDQPPLFDKLLCLKAVISVNQIENYKSLALNTTLSDDEKKSQWIQLGQTEKDGYALQLSFKMAKACRHNGITRFELRQAFVSQAL